LNTLAVDMSTHTCVVVFSKDAGRTAGPKTLDLKTCAAGSRPAYTRPRKGFFIREKNHCTIFLLEPSNLRRLLLSGTNGKNSAMRFLSDQFLS